MGASDAGTKQTFVGKQTCRLLDWQCGALKSVTRSTFATELMAAISSTGRGLAPAAAPRAVLKGLEAPELRAAIEM
eukprot:1472327-Pyramimonas_sp.AAC.1